MRSVEAALGARAVPVCPILSRAPKKSGRGEEKMPEKCSFTSGQTFPGESAGHASPKKTCWQPAASLMKPGPCAPPRGRRRKKCRGLRHWSLCPKCHETHDHHGQNSAGKLHPIHGGRRHRSFQGRDFSKLAGRGCNFMLLFSNFFQ